MIDGAADNAAPIANGVLPHTNGVNGLTNGNGAHHNAQPGPDITGPLNNPPLIPSGQHANYMPIPFFPQIAGGPSNAHVTPYAPGGQGMAMTNGNSSVHGHALANGNSSGHGHTQTNGAGSTNAAENMNVGHTPANATGSANGAGNTNGAGNANGGQTMAFPQYPWYPDAGPGAMSGQAIEFWNGLNRSPIANGSNPWPLILEQPWFDHCDDCRDGRQQIRLISSDEQVYNTCEERILTAV